MKPTFWRMLCVVGVAIVLAACALESGGEKENAADSYGAVFERMRVYAELELAPHDYAGGRYVTERAMSVVRSVEGFDETVGEIVRIGRLDRCEFPELSPNPLEHDLLHLGGMRALVRLVDVEARIAYREGDTDRAAECVLAILGIADHAASEGVLVASLVADWIAGVGASLLAEFDPAAFDAATRRAFAELCERRSSSDALRLQEALVFERDWVTVWVTGLVEEHGGDREALRLALGDVLGEIYPEGEDPAAMVGYMMSEVFTSERWSEALDEQLAAHRGAVQRAIDAWQGSSDEVYRAMDTEHGLSDDYTNLLSGVFLPALNRVREQEIEHDEAFEVQASRYAKSE